MAAAEGMRERARRGRALALAHLGLGLAGRLAGGGGRSLMGRLRPLYSAPRPTSLSRSTWPSGLPSSAGRGVEPAVSKPARRHRLAGRYRPGGQAQARRGAAGGRASRRAGEQAGGRAGGWAGKLALTEGDPALGDELVQVGILELVSLLVVQFCASRARRAALHDRCVPGAVVRPQHVHLWQGRGRMAGRRQRSGGSAGARWGAQDGGAAGAGCRPGAAGAASAVVGRGRDPGARVRHPALQAVRTSRVHPARPRARPGPDRGAGSHLSVHQVRGHVLLIQQAVDHLLAGQVLHHRCAQARGAGSAPARRRPARGAAGPAGAGWMPPLNTWAGRPGEGGGAPRCSRPLTVVELGRRPPTALAQVVGHGVTLGVPAVSSSCTCQPRGRCRGRNAVLAALGE